MKSFKPCLPSTIMGNVRSLANKLHEPTALAWSQRSLMCFTESWINQDIPDDNASVEGFHTVRADMDSTTSGKQEGGELAHLDQPASTKGHVFEFSSAFNTIRWPPLGDKLMAMQVDPSIVSWIVNYLKGRLQYVRLQHCLSNKVVSNTGGP